MINELTEKDKAILAITSQTDLTYGKIKLIIETLDNVSVIFSSNINNLLSKVLTIKEIDKINKIDVNILNSFIKNLERKGIEVITYFSDIYPDYLKEIYSPPLVLYAKGNLDLLSNYNTLSVVGTRRCTNYGREITESFVSVLAKNDIVIVSGLADGIDSIAHKTTLDVKGKTIAVMGSGFDHVYPAGNISLMQKIIEKDGLVLTEYMPSTSPQGFHFPARNRIIAGLSKGVLIIEAPERSGALITKEYALECNREIFVVPGRVTDIYSKGSNEIIKSCQGTIVLGVHDILHYYGKTNKENSHAKSIQLSMEEEIIYNIISVDEVHYETILLKSGLSPAVLNTTLMQMELKSFIKKLPGNIYTSTKI